MGKLNPAMENIMLKKQIKQMEERLVLRENAAINIAKDAALIAANETLKLGPGRAKEFCAAFDTAVLDILHMAIDEADSVERFDGTFDIEYTRTKIDARIKAIVGDENFEPWEERYCWNDAQALMQTPVAKARTGR